MMHKSSQENGIKILKVDDDYLPFLSETETVRKISKQLQWIWAQSNSCVRVPI